MSANPSARIEQLDNIEKDVIAILENAGAALQELSKDRPVQKKTEQDCQTTMAAIKSVDNKLNEQIKYLTQVSTGHPHEGSSYPSQKILQTAWHRLEHAKSRVSELDRMRRPAVAGGPSMGPQRPPAQMAQQQPQQQQQQQQ